MMTLLTAAEVSERAGGFLAAVSVATDVLELRPDYRVLVMVAEGLEPGPPDEVSEEMLAGAEIRARVALDGRAPEEVPQVADWRAAYRAFGAKPLADTGAVQRPQGSARIQHHVRKLREPTGNNGHSAEPLAPRRPAARASQTATERSSRWSLTSGNADERAT